MLCSNMAKGQGTKDAFVEAMEVQKKLQLKYQKPIYYNGIYRIYNQRGSFSQIPRQIFQYTT